MPSTSLVVGGAWTRSANKLTMRILRAKQRGRDASPVSRLQQVPPIVLKRENSLVETDLGPFFEFEDGQENASDMSDRNMIYTDVHISSSDLSVGGLDNTSQASLPVYGGFTELLPPSFPDFETALQRRFVMDGGSRSNDTSSSSLLPPLATSPASTSASISSSLDFTQLKMPMRSTRADSSANLFY